jgi:hypothetical protein
MKNKVLDSTKYVIDNSTNVSIDWDKVSSFTESFKPQEKFNWLKESPFDIEKLSNDERLMLVTIFNSLSFSYWGESYWNVEYKGELHVRGSYSLLAAIFRSIEEGKSLLDVDFISNLTEEELAHILRGNTEIPLLKERVLILNKVGQVLKQKYEGKMINLIKSDKGTAASLVDLVVKEFEPCFKDYYEYKGRTVYFNKRAQALVESMHSLFEGSDYLDIQGVEELTALADYIIPNLLRSFGILKYNQALAEKIYKEELIQSGSEEEIEIRASVIWVVEIMRKNLSEKGIEVSSLSINDYLWSVGGEIKTPFHRTRTTAY